ncbi:MAG: protein phosphatase 2C domain-containing protein [Clostridia bacterium]|nr:protein phosphatase 2C domain-containing protein [Clostridia bacterium]
MKIIQYYAQGARHKAHGIPCEDRTYALQGNGVTVIALADGAGGKEYTYAALGAECVTKTISNFLCNNFDKFYNMREENEMKKVFTAVCQRSLKNLADEKGIDDIMKLSSTLLVVAAKGSKALVCHIGDGAIGKITEMATRVVSAPDNGEFANHTYFISCPDAEEHLTIQKCKIDNVVALFMMSDGSAEYVFDEAGMRFHDSARKMTLMALDEDGESRLAETIETYMIQQDPVSDDCSFIAMVFEERVTSQSVGIAEKRYEGLYESTYEGELIEDLNNYFSQEENEEEYVSSFPVDENRKKHKLIVLGTIVALVLVTVFCIVLAKAIADRKGEKFIPEETTTEEVEFYESNVQEITEIETFDETTSEKVSEKASTESTTLKQTTTEENTTASTTKAAETTKKPETTTEKITETTTEQTTETTKKSETTTKKSAGGLESLLIRKNRKGDKNG